MCMGATLNSSYIKYSSSTRLHIDALMSISCGTVHSNNPFNKRSHPVL
jgi:hypothetical protein